MLNITINHQFSPSDLTAIQETEFSKMRNESGMFAQIQTVHIDLEAGQEPRISYSVAVFDPVEWHAGAEPIHEAIYPESGLSLIKTVQEVKATEAALEAARAL